jgi:hypothetical protein
LTKHLHDELKCSLELDAKIEVAPKIIDNRPLLASATVIPKPKGKASIAKSKAFKRSRLERATSHLYDLEDGHAPERRLDVDFGLYQMEDF